VIIDQLSPQNNLTSHYLNKSLNMPRGNGPVTKVFYKGNTDDFIVFVESPEDLAAWKKDKSIPLAQVVNSFKILLTHKHGAQGQMDDASKASLENEFGTHNEDEVLKKILEDGHAQVVEVCHNTVE
jgi:ribosome maturation protein Sdo1